MVIFRISWCDFYWRGAALLGVTLTSMRVLKGAAKMKRDKLMLMNHDISNVG